MSFTGSYTEVGQSFLRVMVVSSSDSKRNGDDHLKKFATDVFHNRGCVAPHTLNV